MGTCPVITLELGDGSRRAIWAGNAALVSRLKALKPKIGEAIAIRYLGKRRSASGFQYADFTVKVDRPEEAFDWGTPDESWPPLPGEGEQW